MKLLFRSCVTLFLLVICFSSCKNEKDNMIEDFERIYDHTLALNYDAVVASFDEESLEFYNKITTPENLNIDSILSLGNQYNLQHLTTDYLALNGDKIKAGAPKTDFFRYLGTQQVSFYTFANAYYMDRDKSKLGTENFVSIIKEEMTTRKRNWVKMTKVGEEYKLNLLYTLQIHEAYKSKAQKDYRKRFPDKSLEEFLRHYYWEQSGSNTLEFEKEQLDLEKEQIEYRNILREELKSREN